MSGALEGRVALVTGGGRGIGAGISRALAAEGASVAVNYRRDADAAKETVAAIEAAGGSARAYAAAVEDYEAAATMVESAVNDFGYVDILVHNAGIASRGRSVADTEVDELERLVRVHALERASPGAACAAVDAHAAARRHRDDLLGRHVALRRERRAVQHGQGRARGARVRAREGGARQRHPRERRRARASSRPRWDAAW